MYPDRGTFVPCSGYITTRDQSEVESGVTEGGKNTASFTTTKTWSLKLKSSDFQSYPRRETAAIVEEKDADNVGKVLCKSFT